MLFRSDAGPDVPRRRARAVLRVQRKFRGMYPVTRKPTDSPNRRPEARVPWAFQGGHRQNPRQLGVSRQAPWEPLFHAGSRPARHRNRHLTVHSAAAAARGGLNARADCPVSNIPDKGCRAAADIARQCALYYRVLPHLFRRGCRVASPGQNHGSATCLPICKE